MAKPPQAHASPLRLAYYGDDFTGSTDALEFLSRAGLDTVLFVEPPSAEQFGRFPRLQALGVAGLSRSLPTDELESTLRPAFTALRRLACPHVHYKVCSTFDSSPSIGSIGRALEIGMEVFASGFVPLVVGAPRLGRYCVFGNLFARMGIGSAGEIHRLDRHPSMSRHPVTPAGESDLRLHLARQTSKQVALFDVLQWSRPDEQAREVLAQRLRDHPDVVLFDVLSEEHLGRIGGMLDERASRERPLFSVGSSAIEMALGAHWSGEGTLAPRTEWESVSEAQPLLVVSGSCSPVTARQIEWAVAQGFAEVRLEPSALARGDAGQEAARTLAEHLRGGRSVVAHTLGTEGVKVLSRADAGLVGSALGRLADSALGHAAVRRLVVAGGDTSSQAARALGIEAVRMIAPLAPGAPLCRAHAPGRRVDGCEVNFKGGQVGADDYFGAVARGRL